MNLVLPYLHDNGSSKARLVSVRIRAYGELDEAMNALKSLAPNPRDYGSGSFADAVAQHERRLRALQFLMDEIEIECKYIEAAKK